MLLQYIVYIALGSILNNTYSLIYNLIAEYGYLAVFALMLLENSSVPVPSEIILPLAGFFAAKEPASFNFYIALVAALLGSLFGLAIDYFIGYYLGKDIVYRHLGLFHISKKTLDDFDSWFNKNAVPAILVTRLIPVVRTVMSFPAGFAKMPKRKFFSYSMLGSGIYDFILMLFGFEALPSNNALLIMASAGVLIIFFYIVYAEVKKSIRKSKENPKGSAQ